ncbi:MerR family transcriptional regulator [Heyndrickxia ginsengihumi]|uniref:MerR family transcriptional regulator n=1 Tax=Heyndrickxia ginsengihumi TaxID=363870 RepID=UPI00203F3596|nr:MerR family transcriptional regulator [Heyndrickxia ginsengihumi]MCM3022720.1 MerR family transcriptional regulator [Heyndrickxia ginsengihumi]
MKTIKQVSEQLSMPVATIRYYDKLGLVPQLQRDKNGYRQFSEKDIYTLEMIQCFRATGMSVEDLINIFSLDINDPILSLNQRQKIISKQREKLLKQRKQIDDALALVDYKLKRYTEMHQQS